MRFAIRVMPRSSKNVVAGMRDGRLVVRVTAAPVDGAANEAVIKLLARTLGIGRSTIRIATGDSARNKVVEVVGPFDDQARQKLSAILT